jgi:outer membrane lipoprotein SlyB
MNNPIQINMNVRDIAGGAVTGAALNLASGYAGGSGMGDKAMKGAIAGAVVVAVFPTGKNLLNMLWKPKAAAAAK